METLMAKYKSVMRSVLEYSSSIWSPLSSSNSINKLQGMLKAALRSLTQITQDTNIQYLHDETLTLPIHEHLQLHTSQYKQKAQHPSHILHKHTYINTAKQNKILKQRPLHNTHSHRPPHSHYNRPKTNIQTNMRHIYTSSLSRHLATRGNNTILPHLHDTLAALKI